MIKLEGVRKRYLNGHDALRGVNIEIAKGELVFLTGHSGAGKSTLLKLIGLLERPSTGRVTVDGQLLTDIPPRQIPYFRRNIGMIFQSPTLLNSHTVYDNLALPLRVAGFPEQEINNRIHASLSLVGLLKKQKQLPLTLSGGEQQRIGIARAIVSRPAIILADEPTGNLDPELSREIMNLFFRLKQVGITIIIATHDLNLIDKMDAKKLELHNGKVIEKKVVQKKAEAIR